MTKLKDNMIRLLRTNAELNLDTSDKEKQLQKEIDSLRGQLAKEKRQIEKWCPKDDLSIVNLKQLLSICEKNNETYTNFTI